MDAGAEHFYYSLSGTEGQHASIGEVKGKGAPGECGWYGRIPVMMRRIQVWGVLVSLAWLMGCTVYGQKPVKALSDATGGEGLERALWRDIQHKDWKDLENHTASIFVYQTTSGKLDRAAALEQIEKMDVSEYSIGELSTELHGNVFVVTYTVTLRGTLDGQPLPDRGERRMSVWQQQKSGWMLIAHAVIGTA